METSPSPDPKKTKKRSCGCQVLLLLGILFFLFSIVLAPIGGGIRMPKQSSAMQTAHAIGLAMYSYANDNNGNYPDGKSSTEVFQKLVDGGYVTDPAIFYIAAPGKVRAESRQKLKPENICWDVTGGLTLNSPGDVPLVFLTGYRVNYTAGSAGPIAQAGVLAPRTWAQWWNNEPKPSNLYEAGIAVFYVNNSAKFITRTLAPDGTRSIPHLISADYKSDGTTYRQLTPEGVLAN